MKTECFKTTLVSKLSGKQYNLKHAVAVFPKQYFFFFFPIELIFLLEMCLQGEG